MKVKGLKGTIGVFMAALFAVTVAYTPPAWGITQGSGASDGGNSANVALGDNSSATAANTVAVGAFANATSTSATAVGSNADAGFHGTALGTQANADYYGTALGYDSQATGDYSTAVGQSSDASGENSIAIGTNSSATGTNDIAIGGTASGDNSVVIGGEAYNGNNTVIGINSYSEATNGTAVGDNARVEVSATGGIAIGASARVNSGATGSIAIGQSATVNSDVTNAVAIGQNSVADQNDTVSVGSSGSERRITNVADGVDPTDAATVEQLQAAMGGFSSGYDEVMSHVNKLDNRVSDLGALTSAMSALVPNSRAGGNTQISVGAGYYRDSTAVAAGLFHYFTDNILVNAGVSTSLRHSETTGRVGVTYGW
jgi:trimeric autotransporter adhesin